MRDDVVTRCFGDLLMPFVLVFGLYVVWHGEDGPGGGFQGGVIIATAFILYGLLHGMPALRRVLSRRLTLTLTSLGVFGGQGTDFYGNGLTHGRDWGGVMGFHERVYAGVGLACVAAGGRFLDYSALVPREPVKGQIVGITLVEFGVALAVFAVMLTIFEEISED